MRTLHFLFCLPVALVPFLAQDKPEEKAPPLAPVPVPPQILMPIESIVHSLAKGARETEVKDLLRALEKFNYTPANLDRLVKSSKEELTKAKSPIDSLPSGAKQLRTIASQLVPIMEKIADEEQKQEFAKNILRLDGECEKVHTYLGNEKVGKAWVRKEYVEMRKRRGEILKAVDDAKKLDIEMDTKENVDDELIEKYCGVKATVVKRGAIELRSNFSVEKTQRILREVNRAIALSYWIRSGKLRPMPKEGGSKNQNQVVLLIGSREIFKKISADMLAEKKMDDGSAKILSLQGGEIGSFSIKGGPNVRLCQVETSAECDLLFDHAGLSQGTRTALTVGHLNWISLTCFGSLLGNYAVKEGDKKRYGDTRVAGDDRDQAERMRLAKAGIAGSRAWMEYLAERGEDPLWGNSFVNSIGAITGNDLHKCISVAEYLHEAGDKFFDDVYTRVGSTTENSAERYINALKMPLGEFESKWRDWLLGAKPGVAERIDKENLAAWPPDALSVLKYMNQIREDTFKGKLEGVFTLKFDPNLSEQCGAHANYLELHPEQQKWPDAHEEYADKEGYSVEGAWAGGHSVILFGQVEDAKKAIDGWMGTWYHRLPLIDPGVLRLGWGQKGDNWVMDMQSLAAPYDKPYLVLYPYDRQQNVPIKFDGNEFPDPVPELGKDFNEGELLGYPITIETNPIDEKGETVDIAMKLFEGTDGKTEVECWFSSPEKPSNPEIAPRGAWCLMPKEKLKPKTEYKVVAEWHNSDTKVTATAKRMDWTFRTEAAKSE